VTTHNDDKTDSMHDDEVIIQQHGRHASTADAADPSIDLQQLSARPPTSLDDVELTMHSATTHEGRRWRQIAIMQRRISHVKETVPRSRLLTALSIKNVPTGLFTEASIMGVRGCSDPQYL